MGWIDDFRARAAERIAGQAFTDKVERKVRREFYSEAWRSAAEALQTTTAGAIDKLKVDLEQLRTHGAPRQTRTAPLGALQAEFFELYSLCPAVTNAINLVTSIVIGNGIHVDIEGDKGQDAWDDFDKSVEYTDVRAPKSVQDRFLFGEVLHYFLRGGDKPNSPIGDMRVLDPVARGGLKDVIVDRDDAERIIAYSRLGMYSDNKGLIEPTDATHWRLRAPGNSVRGRPILEPAYDEIMQLRQFGLEMFVLRLVRLRNSVWVFSIKDMEDETEEVDDIVIPVPEPAQAMVLPPGVTAERPSIRDMTVSSYKFEDSPMMSAYLGMAQAINVPVHLLMQKFDESTFASALAAEAPTMKSAQRQARAIEALVRRDVKLVLASRGFKDAKIRVRVEPAVFRDMDKERDSISRLVEMRIIDKRTAREQLGYDPDEVEKRLEIEREEESKLEAAMNPLGGFTGAELAPLPEVTDDPTDGDEE